MSEINLPEILRENAEPTVIDQELLVSLLINQRPKGEFRKLFVKDEILNIDFLWILPNLTKLSLSHNMIEKIENLDALVHLKELNLSFNHIKVMENLNHLLKLEVLLLYSNQIEDIKGIDDLDKLRIFNVANNKISTNKHVIYLRKFINLRSFTIKNNPCTKIEGYKEYLLAFNPQLKYFEYKLINEEEREVAAQKYYKEIFDLQEIEKEEEISSKRDSRDKTNLSSSLCIDNLKDDYLFQDMFHHDKKGKLLYMVNENSKNCFEEYRNQFLKICKELYEKGLEQHTYRLDEIKLFQDVVDNYKTLVEEKARTLVEDVLKTKAEILMKIKQLKESTEEEMDVDVIDKNVARLHKFADDFNDSILKTWKILLANELTLHDQITVMNETFRFNIKDIVETFIETVRTYFSELRNLESEYKDSINSVLLFYISEFNENDKMPNHFINVCGDKDILNNNVNVSNEMHLQIIDDWEDNIIVCLNEWLEKFTDEQKQKEEQRNNKKILEVSHFLEVQKKDMQAYIGDKIYNDTSIA
ncbi:dynein regulatory complex subunit 3-like isoform X2 [Prorops nasuta]|uniref:dynein regulatory complex subunit 3-like isoform X2 n=1 Tax=Prorops nasuta TaxID=863751 RepID=UPI0034CDE17C